MTENKNDHVVIAVFSSEEIAHNAADSLKSWDKASEEIKLGAVGVMTADADGKVQVRVGRKTGKGAAVGAIAGIIAGVLSGGVTLVGGRSVGGAFGGIMGAFFKKSTHLTKEEIDKIGAELKEGKGAVIVTCDDDEVEPTTAHLAKLGGIVKSYSVSTDAIDEAVAAGAAAAAAPLSPAERAAAEIENAEPDVPPADKGHGSIVPPPAPF